MRSEALTGAGKDIYPAGPASAYRTYQQQAELYQAYLAGYGAPANPPALRHTSLASRWMSRRPDAFGGLPDRLEVRLGEGPHTGEWWHVDYGGG